MADFEKRIVVAGPFDLALGRVVHAVRDEGLDVVASLDVREHFRRTVRRDFRKYALLEVWSPDLAFLALKRDLPAGTVMPTAIAVYELADGDVAVVARQAHAAAAWGSDCECDQDDLQPIAAQERNRISRVLARLRHVPRRASSIPHAA